MDIPDDWKWWAKDSLIEILPGQRDWLVSLLDAGFYPFTGPAFLIGAKTESRCVLVIHRGRGRFWEICLLHDSKELASVQVTSLEFAQYAGISWLSDASANDVLTYLAPHVVKRGLQ